jgi:hypothetical protein
MMNATNAPKIPDTAGAEPNRLAPAVATGDEVVAVVVVARVVDELSVGMMGGSVEVSGSGSVEGSGSSSDKVGVGSSSSSVKEVEVVEVVVVVVGVIGTASVLVLGGSWVLVVSGGSSVVVGVWLVVVTCDCTGGRLVVDDGSVTGTPGW